jgi:pyrroline-5-carboxylate reductase
MNIGIVGCGNLGTAILDGIRKAHPNARIVASKRSWQGKLAKDENTIYTESNIELIQKSDLLFITLKPYNVLSFLHDHRELLDPRRHTLVSAASSITLREMTDSCGKEIDIWRIMPNTASTVNESITAVSIGADRLKRKDELLGILNLFGETVIIDESLMESATILGACGIAYVLRFMRAMIQGGVEVGFDVTTATKIVSQTVKGAAELIIQNNTHPEQEIDRVTTPKGCTIVGLNEMEHSGFSSALIKGIVTSFDKIAKEQKKQ